MLCVIDRFLSQFVDDNVQLTTAGMFTFIDSLTLLYIFQKHIPTITLTGLCWYYLVVLACAFSVLTLFVGWQEGHPSCKKYGVMGCWRGYLSGVRCKWFAYGSADATATPSSLASAKARMVYLSCTGLPMLSWKKRQLNDCVCFSCVIMHLTYFPR